MICFFPLNKSCSIENCEPKNTRSIHPFSCFLLNLNQQEEFSTIRDNFNSKASTIFEKTFRITSQKLHQKLSRLESNQQPLISNEGSIRHSPANNMERNTNLLITDKTDSLNTNEKKLLALGSKFTLSQKIDKQTKTGCQIALERFAYQYIWTQHLNVSANNADKINQTNNIICYPWKKNLNRPLSPGIEIQNKLHRIKTSFTRIINNIQEQKKWKNLSSQEVQTIKSLKAKELAITPSDRGGEFCLMHLQQYISIGREHLNNVTLYKSIPRMSAQTIENKLNNEWRQISRNVHLPRWIEKSYITKNSNLAKFHHFIKTHKPSNEIKIRPIVAARNTPTSKLTWLINRIVCPLLNNIPAHLKDSAELMSSINGYMSNTSNISRYPVSFDVVSMYTNIPVKDALNALSSMNTEKFENSIHPLSMQNILSLLNCVLNNSFFQYEDKIYQQISGLPMGCSISGCDAHIN